MNERIKELKENYLLRFKRNERVYSPAQAKKKNADLRKLVMTGGIEESRVAIKAAWQEHFGVE